MHSNNKSDGNMVIYIKMYAISNVDFKMKNMSVNKQPSIAKTVQ